MKMVKEVNYDLTVKAVMRNGELSLSLTAAAPYGSGDNERTASATVTEFSEEILAQVQEVLEAAQEEKLGQALTKAEQNAAVSLVAAVRKGEM